MDYDHHSNRIESNVDHNSNFALCLATACSHSVHHRNSGEFPESARTSISIAERRLARRSGRKSNVSTGTSGRTTTVSRAGKKFTVPTAATSLIGYECQLAAASAIIAIHVWFGRSASTQSAADGCRFGRRRNTSGHGQFFQFAQFARQLYGTHSNHQTVSATGGGGTDQLISQITTQTIPVSGQTDSHSSKFKPFPSLSIPKFPFRP